MLGDEYEVEPQHPRSLQDLLVGPRTVASLCRVHVDDTRQVLERRGQNSPAGLPRLNKASDLPALKQAPEPRNLN